MEGKRELGEGDASSCWMDCAVVDASWRWWMWMWMSLRLQLSRLRSRRGKAPGWPGGLQGASVGAFTGV